MTFSADVWRNAKTLFTEWPFNENTAENQVTKLAAEAAEFVENPSEEEAADILVVLLGWQIKQGRTLNDLLAATDRKLKVNMARRWRRMPDGTLQHN